MPTHRNERRRVRPILEQLTAGTGEIVKASDVVCADARERHEELRALEHVDGVELQHLYRVDRGAQCSRVGAGRARPRQSLRVDRQMPSLLDCQTRARPHGAQF